MSNSPSVAVVMAHFDDYNGAVFSIQHLRMTYAAQLEFVIADASTTTHPEVHAKLLSFCREAGVTLIDASNAHGTSRTRNIAIAGAEADIVICIDCHVLVSTTGIDAVKRYFSNETNRGNIVSGQMLYDDLIRVNGPTHFNPQWSSQMWGRWGVAWRTQEDEYFTVVENLQTHNCEFYAVSGSNILLPPPKSFKPIDNLSIYGHEAVLLEAGYDQWIRTAADDDTLEIPGQGLGCFAVWRNAWPGFIPQASGFGGEELCIHELYRKRGGKAECLAGFYWWHRFFRGQSDIPPYSSPVWERIRNYVLWFSVLRYDLQSVEQHFVTSQNPDMPYDEWIRLITNPVNYAPDGLYASNDVGRPLPNEEQARSFEELQRWAITAPRDFEQHIATVAKYAAQCDSAAEFSERRETTIGLLPCRGVIHSYNTEHDDPLFGVMLNLNKITMTHGYIRQLNIHHVESVRGPVGDLPQDVDLLLLDTARDGARITEELNGYASRVKRFIIIHNTQLPGMAGTFGRGIVPAIHTWLAGHSEWFVISHTPIQYGLTVLGRDPADRPTLPVNMLPGGPGTEMQLLLKNIDIEMTPGCNCISRMAEMDALGSHGCRQQFDYIVAFMRENKAKWGIEAKLENGSAKEAITLMLKGMKSWTGWQIGINMLLGMTFDPIEVLVQMAISQAEAKGY